MTAQVVDLMRRYILAVGLAFLVVFSAQPAQAVTYGSGGYGDNVYQAPNSSENEGGEEESDDKEAADDEPDLTSAPDESDSSEGGQQTDKKPQSDGETMKNDSPAAGTEEEAADKETKVLDTALEKILFSILLLLVVVGALTYLRGYLRGRWERGR